MYFWIPAVARVPQPLTLTLVSATKCTGKNQSRDLVLRSELRELGRR
jgi:hypothetical protein